jgi:hypothetical protein
VWARRCQKYYPEFNYFRGDYHDWRLRFESVLKTEAVYTAKVGGLREAHKLLGFSSYIAASNLLCQFWVPWLTSCAFRADVWLVVTTFVSEGYLNADPFCRFFTIVDALPYELVALVTGCIHGQNRASISTARFDSAARWWCTYMDDTSLWT